MYRIFWNGVAHKGWYGYFLLLRHLDVYRMERLLWNFVNLVGWTDGMHGFKDGVALIGWCGSYGME